MTTDSPWASFYTDLWSAELAVNASARLVSWAAPCCRSLLCCWTVNNIADRAFSEPGQGNNSHWPNSLPQRHSNVIRHLITIKGANKISLNEWIFYIYTLYKCFMEKIYEQILNNNKSMTWYFSLNHFLFQIKWFYWVKVSTTPESYWHIRRSVKLSEAEAAVLLTHLIFWLQQGELWSRSCCCCWGRDINLITL